MFSRHQLMIVALSLVFLPIAPCVCLADEVATLQNRSTITVWFYVKWSNLTEESAVMKLDPGQSYRTFGPDGHRLDIRFNSAAGGGPVRELRYVLRVARTYDPRAPGAVSAFVNVGGPLVDLR